MQRTVVVPSATTVPVELAVEFGAISPARMPVAGTTLGALIRKAYLPHVNNIVFALTSEEIGLVRSGNVEGLPRLTRLACADRSRSLAETVLSAFRERPFPGGSLIVNFGDTLVERALANEDRIVVARRRDLTRWTTLAQSPNMTWRLFEKNRRKPPGYEHLVVTGVFEFRDGDRFLENLHSAQFDPTEGLDPFFAALVRYLGISEIPDPTFPWLEITSKWLDFGHLDGYFASKLEMGVGARSFNTVNVDQSRGVVTKASKHTDKFSDEIAWYHALPPSVRHLAPRVLSEPSNGHLSLEYYGYPSVQDLYLHGQLGLGDWEILLHVLGDGLDAFATALPSPPIGDAKTIAARRAMYLDKTLERMSEVASDPTLLLSWQTPTINGLPCPTGTEIIAELSDTLRHHGLLDPRAFSFIHGDYCISNLLYDRRNRIVRTIDPRGRFGEVRFYGDSLYDEAKLAHSFHGDYDFLVNGTMQMRISEKEATLEPTFRATHVDVKELFDDWQRSRLREDFRAVRLIESLLFLSMVPLHADRPESQKAFALRGRELYTRATRGEA